MKPINQLLKTLKEIKENRVINDYWIEPIKDAVIDYQNETWNRDFDDLLNEFVSEEQVLDCVRRKCEQGDFWGVSQIMEGLSRADRYKDNGDYFENIDDDDVEERLDDIISLAKDIKSGK